MKKVEAITDMNLDFPQWYTDVVKKAKLIDYSPIKGCIIFRPYGYRIWELVQGNLDKMLKNASIENVYMPMLIPQSLLQKEKDHVEGFAPEVALVTKGGDEELADPLCIRPTSEVLFCEHFSHIVQSYRDLPLKYNQWCSVVRWEKTTRPFLRTTEFLWQEGHTVHATAREADDQALEILDIYTALFEDILAIPVVRGRKTEKEKFAGAVTTYTIESIMHDGKALQSGTTHNFGNGFAKVFDISYTDENNNLQYAHQSSWGVSTRTLGALIMVHGDNSGLVLPPKIAPFQVVIVPVAQNKAGVLDAAAALKEKLSPDFRVFIDNSDKSPGWKFSEYEMQGVPLRLELGPKDIEKNQAVLVRRDTGEKIIVDLADITEEINHLLEKIQSNLYNKAKISLESKTHTATNMKEFTKILEETPGFIKAMWCGEQACEDEIKEKTSATIRCIPDKQETISDGCICCGKNAEIMVYFAKAY